MLQAEYGNYTWASARLLAWRLLLEVDQGAIDVATTTVLELGCGTALPGLLAARCGVPQVVLSDAETQLDAAGLARLRCGWWDGA